MALTPSTSSLPFLTPTDFLARYDSRFIGELCSDSGVPVSPSDLLSDPNLGAALSDASAVFESAVRVGGRYSPEDLNNLLFTLGIGGSLILRCVADLTIQYLRRRRGMSEEDNAQFKDTQSVLKALRDGESNLGFLEADQAGHIQVQAITPSDYEKQGLITSNTRFWGQRHRTAW